MSEGGWDANYIEAACFTFEQQLSLHLSVFTMRTLVIITKVFIKAEKGSLLELDLFVI